MLLDRADRAIVTALQENARLTNVELSERIGLSPSACLRRVNTLERKGLIAGYHATIDMAKIDYDVMVMVQITLTGQASTILNDFHQLLIDFRYTTERRSEGDPKNAKSPNTAAPT